MILPSFDECVVSQSVRRSTIIDKDDFLRFAAGKRSDGDGDGDSGTAVVLSVVEVILFPNNGRISLLPSAPKQTAIIVSHRHTRDRTNAKLIMFVWS
jgi:hypothetical protein